MQRGGSAFLAGLAILASSVAVGQAQFDAKYREEVTYPSLTSRHVLKLTFSDWAGIWSGFGLAPADWEPLHHTAPFHDPSRYYVKRSDNANGERIPIERVEFAKCPEADPCSDGNDYFSAYLVLGRGQLRKGNKVIVYLKPPGQSGGVSDTANPHSNEQEIMAVPPAQVTLTPAYVPNVTLSDKTQRNVAQLSTNITTRDLNVWQNHARSYFAATGLFSTDHKDPATKFESRWRVAERALPGAWYLPVFLESKAVGDQRAENLSWVNSAGISGLIPWGWTRSALSGPYLQIPASPIWSFAFQDEYRAIQDVPTRKKFPDTNAARLFGELTWDPIRLLPGKGSETMTLELAARGWYFPSDRNSLNQKIQRLEGQFEVSLLVPITKLMFESPALIPADMSAVKQRIRIKYAVGANEAQAFRHSSQLSLGVEFLK